MSNRFFDEDNPDTNPELVNLRYRLGRSPIFEVNLVLDEFAENVGAALSNLPAFVATNTSAGGFGGGGGGGGCPRVDQWLWRVVGTTVKPIEAHKIKEGNSLHNPITGEAQRVVVAEIVKNQPIMRVITHQGGELFCSASHPIIRFRTDGVGTACKKLKENDSAMSWLNETLVDDMVGIVEKAGKGDYVKITLEKGFIYAAGSSPENCIVGHNLKRSDEDDIF